MFNPGNKVRLKIDHSKIGIVAAVVSQEPVASYLVFHDQNSSETYFEDQIEIFEENKVIKLS